MTTRVGTGISKLDDALRGGFPSDSVVLLSGSAGAGKTLIALNYLLAGAEKGERCVYLSLGESREELLRACEGIDQLKKVAKHEGKNIIFLSAVMGEKITPAYFTRMVSTYRNIDRLVIDNLNRLLIFADGENDYRKHLYDLSKHLRGKVKSSLLLSEADGSSNDDETVEAFESDGIVHLSFVELEEKPRRTLTVTKMRYTDFEPRVSHELSITSKRIDLTGTTHV